MSQSLILPLLIVVLAVPLFFSYRKQKRAAAQQQDLQNSIGEGDRVMTTSGLYATVRATSEKTIDLEIAPGVVTTWLRQAVREKVADESGIDAITQDADETAESNDSADTNANNTATVAPPLEHGTR